MVADLDSACFALGIERDVVVHGDVVPEPDLARMPYGEPLADHGRLSHCSEKARKELLAEGVAEGPGKRQ